MRFVSVVLLLAASLVGCGSLRVPVYVVPLTQVERPADATERYGEQTISSTQEEGITRYSFEDAMVKIDWLPSTKNIAFRLTNKTDHSIKIIWDEAAFVGPAGESQRVMHSGVKYTDRNSPQPPSVVARGATITDLVFPADNAYFVSGQYGGWREKPILPEYTSAAPAGAEAPIRSYVGRTMQVLLPLQIEDVVNEYIFTFTVKDVIVAP